MDFKWFDILYTKVFLIVNGSDLSYGATSSCVFSPYLVHIDLLGLQDSR